MRSRQKVWVAYSSQTDSGYRAKCQRLFKFFTQVNVKINTGNAVAKVVVKHAILPTLATIHALIICYQSMLFEVVLFQAFGYSKFGNKFIVSLLQRCQGTWKNLSAWLQREKLQTYSLRISLGSIVFNGIFLPQTLQDTKLNEAVHVYSQLSTSTSSNNHLQSMKHDLLSLLSRSQLTKASVLPSF